MDANVWLLLSVLGLKEKYMQASPNITAILLSSPNLTYSESCKHHLHPKANALKILRGPKDPDLPWPGFLLGQTPASIWYFFSLTFNSYTTNFSKTV